MTLAEMLDYMEDKAAFERLLSALDVPAFALKNPVVVGRLEKRHSLVTNDFRYLKRLTDKPIKVTLPGPYANEHTGNFRKEIACHSLGGGNTSRRIRWKGGAIEISLSARDVGVAPDSRA